MIYETKILQLKNGETAVFRSPAQSDAARMLDYLKDTASETQFVIRYPEECTETEEQEAAFLERLNGSALDMMIVCIVDGEIAGSCQLALHGRIKTKHRADIAVALRKKYWNLGIGTAMISELKRVAREHGALQLELEYIEGNERARHLYEKMGFVPVAQHPDAIRLKDGTMLKMISMLCKL